MGVSPYLPDERNERCSEISLICGERALPGWGGSRQPLDRQLRYYSEAIRLASAGSGSRLTLASKDLDADFRLMRETPLAVEWRFGVLGWSLASQNTWPVAVSTVPTAGFAAGPLGKGRSLAVAQAVPTCSWAGRIFSSSLTHHWRPQ